ISANAYVDAPNRALLHRVVLTGTICRESGGEAPFEALYPAAAPRACRRTFPTASEHRCAVASSRRCLLLDNGHPPQHRPDIVEERFTVSAAPSEGGARHSRRQQR